MSRIHIQRQHLLGAEQVKQRLAKIEASLLERYGVTLQWAGNSATIHSTNVSGSVVVDEEQLRIDMRLGLLFWPFAHTIRESLTRQVDEQLASV
jgi:putative polyhydroxyalkanoate system protein